MRSLGEPLYKILQVALGAAQDFLFTLDAAEWQELFAMAKKQSVLGIAFDGICLLPKEKRPPKELTLRWSCIAESIRGMNEKMNREAARITRLFEEHGRRSVILKGRTVGEKPANWGLFLDNKRKIR